MATQQPQETSPGSGDVVSVRHHTASLQCVIGVTTILQMPTSTSSSSKNILV